jgi:cytochrome b561
MFALPLVGWSMLSAGGYPVLIFGDLQLPSILPLDAGVYAALRRTHTILAILLFGVFLAHLSAALFHALIRRDQVLDSIT